MISIGRLAAWCCLVAIAVVSVAPIGFRPTISASADLERIVTFALCSSFFCIGYPNRQWIVIPGLILTAAVLELMQMLSPTRHAEFSDFVAKAAGVLLGAIVYYGLRSLFAKKNSK